MKPKGWKQKNNDHDRANWRLQARSQAETADNHQKGCQRAKKRCAFGKQNACGSDRIGPAPHIAETVDQHAPTENDPQNRFGSDNPGLMLQSFLLTDRVI